MYPTSGAYKSLGHTQVWSLLLMLRGNNSPGDCCVRIRRPFEIFL